MKLSSLVSVLLQHRAALSWAAGFVVGALVSIKSLWGQWIGLWAVHKSIGLFLGTVLFFEGMLYLYRTYRRSRRQDKIKWTNYVQQEVIDWFGWIGFIVIIFGGSIGASNAAVGTAYEASMRAITDGLGLAFAGWGLRRMVDHWTGSRRRRKAFLSDLWEIIQGYRQRDLEQAAGGAPEQHIES